MLILTYFVDSGVPKTGLSPTIRIRDLSDNSLVITDGAMVEVGDGLYKYDFEDYDNTVDYAIRCDGTATLSDSDRYSFAGSKLVQGFTADAVVELADAVWDESLTGATHNIATSAGKRLRQAGVDAALIHEETCQAGSTASTIKLDLGASATNNFYDHMWVYIVAGTGAGQVRTIHEYNGTTKIANVYPDWLTTPDATSEFTIISLGSSHVHELENLALEQINVEVDTALIDYDAATGTELGTILQVLTGKWAIVGNQLIMYDADDEPLYTFDLKNAAGDAASIRIFSREPA